MKNQRKRSKNARGHVEKDGGARLLFVWLVWLRRCRLNLCWQARPPLVLDLSFNIGPIAAQLDITKPIAQPATGVFKSTLHIHARDDTQTPASTPTSSRSGRLQILIPWSAAFCPPRLSSRTIFSLA